MPRPNRADEAGSICHALNRGNARQTIFHKPEDYEAFLRVLGEGLERYPVELFAFTNPLRAGLVRRAEAWPYSSLWRWTQVPEPEPRMLSPWPIARIPNWIERVNQPLSEKELADIRVCVQRGRPFGGEAWVREVAERAGLGYTLRSRGRPRNPSATAQK